jgi:hypothetical protein
MHGKAGIVARSLQYIRTHYFTGGAATELRRGWMAELIR